MGESRILSPLHYKFLDLLRSESRVYAFHGANKYLASKMEVSETTVKTLLRDLLGPQAPKGERPKNYTGKQKRRPPLQAGLIEIHTTKPKRVNGAWQKQRTIYLVSNVDDETGARQVATLASRFGQETRYGGKYFCGQLQCTPMQFRHWLNLCVKYRWLEVLPTEGGKRLIRRVADCIPYVDQLPNRLCREVYDKQTGRLLRSESTWERLREPTLADRVRELVVNEHGGLCVLSDPAIARRLGAPKRSVTAAIARLKAEERVFSHPFAPGGGRGRILTTRKLTDEEVKDATPLTKAKERKLLEPRPPKRRRGQPAQPKTQHPPPVQSVFRHPDLVAAVNQYIDERNRNRIDKWMPELPRWELSPDPDRTIGESYLFSVALKEARLRVDRAWSAHIEECYRHKDAEERESEEREHLRVWGREHGPWTSEEWRHIELLRAYVHGAARRLRKADVPFDVLEARRDVVLVEAALDADGTSLWGPAERREYRRLVRERRSRALRRSLGMMVRDWQPAARLARVRDLDAQVQRRATGVAAETQKLLFMREPAVFPMVVSLLKSVCSGEVVGKVTAAEISEAIAEVRCSGSAKADYSVAEAAAQVVATKRMGAKWATRLEETLARAG
jgi:hypothetical protein